MYSFNNDYSEGASPQILDALIRENLVQNSGYGLDGHCRAAADRIRQEICRPDADVHFLTGGTQTNLIAIAAELRPWQAVISASTGHINVHETGAVEAAGHKVLTAFCPDGKLTPDQIAGILALHTDEHMVQPRMVYISDSTEVGTRYTKQELSALSGFCREHGLYLFLDGARLGSALTCASNDLTLADIAALTDLFYIGGTKNGALLGEALVIVNEALKPDFRYMIKQRGAMLAKGWIAGIQFEELFRDGLFYRLASHANEAAGQLRQALEACGVAFAYPPCTNQLFPILPDAWVEALSKDFQFQFQDKPDSTHTCVRLVTSWATPPEAAEAFRKALLALAAG